MTDPESGAHPIPVFDGTNDEPDEPERVPMQLHDLFFDLDGSQLDPETFRKQYPNGRMLIKSEGVLGLRVCTEFVGINHNPYPGGEPLIFETTISTDFEIVYSEWSATLERADYAHTWGVWVALVRGPAWQLGALLQRLPWVRS